MASQISATPVVPTVALWLNLNGKLRRIICIPLEEIRSLCKFPIKWVFFIANLAYGAMGRGSLYKRGGGSVPLRLRRVFKREMEEQDVDSNYYFVGPEGEVPRYVDPSAMSDRASDDDWSDTKRRKPRLFAQAVLRDRGCVICNEDESACDAAHIIPHVRGDSYLEELNATRYQRAVGRKATKIDSLQNVLLVSANVHLRMKTCAAAFLCLTPGSILHPSEIPDGPEASAMPKPLREATKAKIVGALGQAAVDKALKEETRSKRGSTKTHIIFQYLDDFTDPSHPHNTRTRVPQILKRGPAQYLLDFHYVSSVIQRWGSEEALGHRQPLKEALFRGTYYDVPTRDDPDDCIENEIQVAEFIVVEAEREDDAENEKDRDDYGSEGDTDRDPMKDEEDSEEYTDSDGRDTRPPTPTHDLEPAMNFLLSWTTKKPLMEESSIKAWASTISGE